MFIDIDYDKRKKGYKINLAKPNQQTIASISEAYGANYSIKLGNINEVTFNVPYFIDKLDERVKNENIELIKEKMYTKISYNNNDEWMVIDTIEDVGSGDEKYMTVTAFTNVYETSNRKINELNLEVVNPEEYYDAVLNDVAWSIGTIDPLFKDIYRSVELSNVTVLEAIITGAETFGAVLDFDTENKKINLIDMDSRAKYRGLNINYSNFLQSINRKRSVDEMTTRLYVYGSEDLSIENVNPTGMRYLEDFTYFLYPFERDENKNVIKSSHYMSDELAHAILDKNELSKEYQPQIKAMQKEIDEETVEYINETTLLNELRFDEMSVSGLLDIAKATGDSNLILQRQGELAEVKTKISIKELTVDHISATIEDLERQISQLQSQISVTSFSKELYDELSMYIIESEFRDDRYIDEEELYRDALKKFDESKSPSVVIEASIDNIIDSLEEDYYSDKVVLGDIARVTDKEMSVEMKSLIVELSFDLDNNTCDVTIANGDIEKDGYDRILSVLYDTQSTTTMLENNKYKWDTVTDVKTEVDLMRDGEIDATRNRIKAGFKESVTIEDRGIILSNPDFPNEIVIMQAGVIALSTDGGENWSTSITPRGVVAETIIGRLVASNNLIVTNDSGSFRIDGEGLTVDMDSIKIMSGEGDTPENIVDSWNEMLITMDEFADDGKLNEYEKNQIARQWNSIAIAHSSMVDAIQNAYGPETPENPYPAEYEIYMESYEKLRSYLNDEIQSDGHTILDPLHRGETTDIDSDKYNGLVSDYEVNKDRFQTVIPMEFSQTFMEQTRQEISLNYVKNGEVATKLNLSEEGVRIDGRLLEVNSETHFNDDLVMNAGLIRSADGAINIDLNAGVINLSRPLTINAFPVATEEFVEESLSDAVKDIDVEYGITSDKNTPPSDWNTTPPAWEDGKYIWSRTITVYKNGNTEITEPVNITGATGSSGGTGQSGRSVKSIQEQYYLSTSPLDLENGSWGDNPPEWEADKYIWTRSVITYENPSGVDRTDPISVSGQQGPKGETGSDGKDAPLVKLSGKTQIIKQDNTGRLTPASNFTVTGSSVNTTINSWRYSTDGGDFISSPPVGVARSGATITVNPTLVEFNTLTIRASDGKVSDDFTIARAVDGATGEDAYTVILTNESHTFAGNIFSAVPSSTTADIIAYKGDVRVPVTVDSITGTPKGMNTGISSNGTINTRVTFTVDEKLVEESGTVKLNLVLSGNFITKEFSFAVAYKGERGEKGERGATGNRGPIGNTGTSVVSVTEYYLATSASKDVTTSTDGWKTDMQPMSATNKYLWNYEKINFSNNTSQPTIPVIIGVYGDKGNTGATGRSITSIQEYYMATSASKDVKRPSTDGTNGWTTTMQPTTETKKYLWNYEKITWSSAPLTTYVDPIIIGVHGAKGPQGPQGAQGPRGLRGLEGPEGKQGIQGPEGKDGISTYTHIAYATSKTGANFEHSTFDDATYIGMYVSDEIDSSDSPADYEWTLIKGKDGTQGIQGPEGVGGITPYFHTAWANNSTGTSGFSTTVSNNKLYIGTCTSYARTGKGRNLLRGGSDFNSSMWENVETATTSSLDSRYQMVEAKGAFGTSPNTTMSSQQGWNFEVGQTYTVSVWARTDVSGSRLGETGGESIVNNNPQEITSEWKRYFWTYEARSDSLQRFRFETQSSSHPVWITQPKIEKGAEATEYSIAPEDAMQDSTNPEDYSWTKIKGDTGDRGPQGAQGPQGPQGVSITKVDVEYAQNKSATTAPTSGWSTNAPTWKNGQYIWSRTKTTYSSGNPTYSKPACITGQKGSVGGEGNDGKGISGIIEQYYLSDSKETRTGGSWTTTVPKWEQGKYMWTRSQIKWVNPTGTTYTDPIVDSAWEAMQEGTKGIGLADKTEILSGTEIFTDKADDSVVHVEIDGRSVGGGSGKNLFKDFPEIKNGFKYEHIDRAGEGGLRIDGNSISQKLVNSETYTLSLNMRGSGTISMYRISSLGNSALTLAGSSNLSETEYRRITLTFTPHRAELDALWIYTAWRPAAYTAWFEIEPNSLMLEKGTTASAYEPPTPSPDYPIEIHSLNDFDVLSSVGRENLFTNSSTERTASREFLNNANWDMAPIFDKFGTDIEYTISFDLKSAVSGSINVYAQNGAGARYGIGTHSLQATTEYKRFSITFKPTLSDLSQTRALLAFFGQAYDNGRIPTVRNVKMEIGRGSVNNQYLPSPTEITENDNHPLIDKINLLLSEPLRSVGDVKDRLFRDSDGLWKVERNVGEYVFDSSLAIQDRTSVNGANPSTNWYQFSGKLGDEDVLEGVGISSHFKKVNNSTTDEVHLRVKSFPRQGFIPSLFFKVGTFKDLAELQAWLDNEKKDGRPLTLLFVRTNSSIEILDQELQDKLNNLRSFQDSNYVYTIIDDKTDILSENLKPTLHATFKGGGWYDRWKTEDELEKHQRELANKTDVDVTNKINDDLAGMVIKTENDKELGEITTKLNEYLALVDQTRDSIFGVVDEDGNPIQEGVTAEVEKLLDRAVAVEREMGILRDTWNFEVTQITMAEEGLFVGTKDSNMGILIAPDRKVDGKEIPAGIYFQDAGETIAFISGQMMQINRGIFVDSAQIGEHQIETISGGHTIFRWIPKPK